MIIRHIVFILKPMCLFNIFLIGNKTFIEKKLNIMCTMVNTLNKKKKQKDQELKEIELKNQIQQYNSYAPKHESKETEYEKVNILDFLMFSPCLQKCGYYVPARLTTLNMSGPYFK